jgi:hypothetical protein
MGGFYGLMDEIVAVGLGVPVETYIKIIETKCTEEEATFIITTFIDEDDANFDNAKETFNKYLNE